MSRFRSITLMAVSLLSSLGARGSAQQIHSDVLMQVDDGQIVIGAADYDAGTWTIGQRVFQRQFMSNFRTNDPGFDARETGSPVLEPGLIGFPPNHGVYFDLLPMRIDSMRANLYYWNAMDEVEFVLPPENATWNIFDFNFIVYTADGSDALVQGGLIKETSSDTDPFDGIDTGSIHEHLLLRLDDGDGNTQTNPPEGVYMIALQARSEGFGTSDPFLFVHRTFNISDAARDAAAAWADANYDSMFRLPGDYNDDGVVNAADYVVWRDALGSMENLVADGDGSKTIDPGDYAVWQDNFGGGAGSPSASAVIPEPSGVILPLLGVAACGLAFTPCGRWPRRRALADFALF